MNARGMVGALLAAALFGCSLSPHYVRPSLPQPPRTFKEAGDWKVAAPADTSARGPWWTMFGDSDLDALETLWQEVKRVEGEPQGRKHELPRS